MEGFAVEAAAGGVLPVVAVSTTKVVLATSKSARGEATVASSTMGGDCTRSSLALLKQYQQA